jgi:hypothetical protein
MTFVYLIDNINMFEGIIQICKKFMNLNSIDLGDINKYLVKATKDKNLYDVKTGISTVKILTITHILIITKRVGELEWLLKNYEDPQYLLSKPIITLGIGYFLQNDFPTNISVVYPLSIAISNNDIDMIYVLLKYGASIYSISWTTNDINCIMDSKITDKCPFTKTGCICGYTAEVEDYITNLIDITDARFHYDFPLLQSVKITPYNLTMINAIYNHGGYKALNNILIRDIYNVTHPSLFYIKNEMIKITKEQLKVYCPVLLNKYIPVSNLIQIIIEYFM